MGDVLHYSFDVNNSGFVSLLGPVTVSDDKATDESCPAVNTVGDLDDYLDPGETITCTATYTVTAGDVSAGFVTNTASASVGGVTSNTDSATVNIAPDFTVAKTNDVSNTVAAGSPFTWTIAVSNTSAGAGTFANTQTILSDTLPGAAGYYPQGALTVTNGATPPTGTINCSITGTALACVANGSVTFPANGSFSIAFTVTPTASGSLANTATVDPNNNIVEISEANNSSLNTVTVVAAPAISKSFSPDPVAVGGTSTLTFTITNPDTATALTSVGFTDSLPAGLEVASTPNVSISNCGTPTFSPTAGATSLTFSAGTIAASGTCTVSVDVVATTAGDKNNTSGAVTSTNGGTGNTASDTLTVLAAPSITKAFSPDLIAVDGTSTLSFTITNPNAGTALTGVAFTDSFPSGLEVASTPNASTSNCGTPTFAPTAGATSLTFSAGTIAASGTCTVSVDVTATTAGVKDNTTGNVTSTNGGTGNTANDTLEAVGAVKTIVSTSESSTGLVSGFERVAIGEVIRYRLTVDLPEGTWNNVQITDAIDTGIQFLNDGTAAVTYTCDGSCTNSTFTITPATFSSSTDVTFDSGHCDQS